MNYTSELKVCGLPLISVVFEKRKTKAPNPAIGFIAIGQYAFGAITISQFGIGIISIFQFGIGALGIFQFGIALASISQFGLNLFTGIGQNILNIL